jgi:predicted ATPase
LAVICGCHAGLFREALHEVYIPRIQRGDTGFAANVLGVRGALLSALIHFFERGGWESAVEIGIGENSLTAQDQLFILMQAGLYLTATRGYSAREVQMCYERAESLCHSLNSPLLLYVALIGQWRYSLWTNRLAATKQISNRVYLLAEEQNDAALLIGAYRALTCTHYFLGDFDAAQRYASRGIQILRSREVQSPVEELHSPAVSCLYYDALSRWHLGKIDSCHAAMAEAISLAKQLKDMHALAVALWHAAFLAHYDRNFAEVQRFASHLIELSTNQHFATWLPGGAILHGWARSASGETAEGISRIEQGIRDYVASGSILAMPYYLALKAEALYLADRNCEALTTISEAEATGERFGERWWSAELCRLRGVFLTVLGADEAKIEGAFSEAISISKEQKSISLEKRAEATYAEYLRQKPRGSGGRGFRLPLC